MLLLSPTIGPFSAYSTAEQSLCGQWHKTTLPFLMRETGYAPHVNTMSFSGTLTLFTIRLCCKLIINTKEVDGKFTDRHVHRYTMLTSKRPSLIRIQDLGNDTGVEHLASQQLITRTRIVVKPYYILRSL